MDILNEFVSMMEKNPTETTKICNDAWKQLVCTKSKVLQIGADIKSLTKIESDLTGPWKKCFPNQTGPFKYE